MTDFKRKRLAVAILFATGFALLVPTGSAAAAPPLPGTGSASTGSSGGEDSPIVGDPFVGNTLKWDFPAAAAPYVVSVRVTPDNSDYLQNPCVNDRTGAFAFDMTVGVDGSTRSDQLWIKASQSIFDGCAFAPSVQSWRVEYSSFRDATDLSRSAFAIQYYYQKDNLRVSASSRGGDDVPIQTTGSIIEVRPAR